MSNYFPKLVGQNAVKKKLSFYIDAFKKTSKSPFILMAGAKGLGKTEFAKSFAENLSNHNGSDRKFIEINCSTIKNVDYF
jgi:Holliday junction resolvasome RuvABC ATP-dependent DNA helicase subunit